MTDKEITPAPPVSIQTLPSPTTDSETKLKMMLNAVFDVVKRRFKKSDAESRIPPMPTSIQTLPSPTTDSETKLKLMLNTVYQLFKKGVVEKSEEETKEAETSEAETSETETKKVERYKPPKVVYEPDMNSDECLEHLEPTLHEFYEPITTYIDEDLRQGTCVYKLKDRNMADGAKEKTIHRTYPLQAA